MISSSRAGWIVLGITGLLCSSVIPAQRQNSRDADNEWHRALKGSLTAWVPLCNADGSSPGQTVAGTNGGPVQYAEATAGSFGQTASSFGTAASNTGQSTTTPSIAASPSGTGFKEQTSGSFGANSSSTGTTASSYGTTAGSFGMPSSSTGTAASSYGTTAGSFGGTSIRTANGASSAAASAEMVQALGDALVRRFSPRVQYVAIECDRLSERLDKARETISYPDLLVGNLPRSWTADVRSRYLLPREQEPNLAADGLVHQQTLYNEIPIYLLREARNPVSARALMMELSESCVGCIAQPNPFDADWKPIHDTAQESLERLALGDTLGSLKDPQFAEFLSPFGLQLSVTEGTGKDLHRIGDAEALPAVTAVRRIGSLGVATARIVTSGKDVFGLTYAFVVLRKGDDGQWRVLHVGLNLPASTTLVEAGQLLDNSPPRIAEAVGGPRGVTLASPPDGDSRLPMPELWWDNRGGAGLQVVEWQTASGNGWANPRLYFVQDLDARLHTRQVAEFATETGRYRWRVWSLGSYGTLTITPWRSFVIVSR